MKKIYYVLMLAFILGACGSKKQIVKETVKEATKSEINTETTTTEKKDSTATTEQKTVDQSQTATTETTETERTTFDPVTNRAKEKVKTKTVRTFDHKNNIQSETTATTETKANINKAEKIREALTTKKDNKSKDITTIQQTASKWLFVPIILIVAFFCGLFLLNKFRL